MKFIIDRFEENSAVIELSNGETCNIPKILIPDAKEGDVFDIIFNKEETLKRKDNISKKFNSLFDN